jgi:hypothetical protein
VTVASVEEARQAVYAAGVIIDIEEGGAPPSLERLAEACDLLDVRRPVALQEALAQQDRNDL